MDELIIWQGSGSSLRRERLLDEIALKEAELERLPPDDIQKIRRVIREIEDLGAQLDELA